MTPPGSSARAPEEVLTELVYELLDAHHDTIELAAESSDGRLAPEAERDGWCADPDQLWWRVHLDYLRALQRTARGLLAQLAADPAHAANPAKGWR